MTGTQLSIRIVAGLLALLFLNPLTADAQVLPGNQIAQQYSKKEVRIPMRDGKSLHAVIYAPRDKSKKYPIMLKRTPYSCQPYGDNTYPNAIGPSEFLEQDGFIFVHQDVRGRWMSEGQYDNMRPHVDGDSAIDESSDTYDTIEWLTKNVEGNTGKVGMWGISYPGFYTTAALPEHHPALVAASPQAPISDFYFDDFHHNGAYLLSYFKATNTFGFQHKGPTSSKWYPEIQTTSNDDWTFFMNLGPLSNADPYMGKDNFFWDQLSAHPNYDEFWQKRSILPHLKNIKANVMTVGGWYDAEDLYGPLNIYKSIEAKNPEAYNVLVMGPWEHGDWSRRQSNMQVAGNLSFGRGINDFYRREIEAPFFKHFLKDQGGAPKFEAFMYDTGKRKWNAYKKWPPAESKTGSLYLRANRLLANDKPATGEADKTEFFSDPSNPVPHRRRQDIRIAFTPRHYMTDDQRFATARPDVLTFQSGVLTQDVTFVGDLTAHLNVSTTGTAADWAVKLIDVYPNNHPQFEGTPQGIIMAGYQQMVRSDVMRGRFRNSFEKPEPFVPNEVTKVKVPLQDICHTFKKGHRIMIHVQSTWFPLIDRNPQKYVDNIFEAKAEDFISATHRVHHDDKNPSWIEYSIVDSAEMMKK